jgi:mannose-6-phosphate isomerase-like protein (cupin superfamily)
MRLLDDARDAINLLTTPLHLGPGSRARAVEGFEWEPETHRAYGAAVADDGAEGRLVDITDGRGPGDHWELHPAGAEVVICLSGTVTVVRLEGGTEDEVVLGPGQATVNPAGVWHTVDLDGLGRILTITPTAGTEHEQRTARPGEDLLRSSSEAGATGGGAG